MRGTPWNRNRAAGAASSLLAAALLVTGPSAAEALNCYTSSGYFYSVCSSSRGTDYEYNAAMRSFFNTVDNRNLLLFCINNDLTVYDVGNPLSPQALASLHIPWDWKTIDGDPTHGPYVDHIKNIATLPGFRYGIVSLGDYGWDFLKASGTEWRFLGNGFKPALVLSNDNYLSAALFSDSAGNVWAAAQKLDQASIDGGDNMVYLYKLADSTGAVNPETYTLANFPQKVRIPVGGTSDGAFADLQVAPIGNIRFSYATLNGRRLLFLRRSYIQNMLVVVDVTNPTAPVPVLKLTPTNDAKLFSGNWALDEAHSMLWVAEANNEVVHGYKINVPAAPAAPSLSPLYMDVCWAAPELGGCPRNPAGGVISVYGDLLAVGGSKDIAYLSLAGNGPPMRLQSADQFTSLNRVCTLANFWESVQGLRVFQPNGSNQHYVARSLFVDGDIVNVSNSCMSTIPLPDFIVTSSETASCSTGSGYPQAAKGFPGDTFTITDASAGVWTTATLDIQQPLGVSIGADKGWNGQVTITPGQSVLWTPPANTAPGDFYVVLSIAGGTPPSTTKVISLCGNPQAALTVSVAGRPCATPATGCTGLVNDAVALGNTGTTGHPSTTGPTYVYQYYKDTVPTGYTSAFNLDRGNGQYKVAVIVPYDFAAGDDPRCADSIFTGLTPGLNSHYDSCMVGTVDARYGVASFQVEQPFGTKVADASLPGTVLVDQPIYLKFTGRIASGYYPNFTWTIPGMIGLPSCTYSGAPSYTNATCTIPANSMPEAMQQSWDLKVDVCSAGGLGNGCTGLPADTVFAPTVRVTPSKYSFEFNVAPTSVNVGDPITITLTKVNGSFSILYFNLGGTACDLRTQISYSCAGIFGNQCIVGATVPAFSYGPSERGKVDIITATGVLAGGPTITSLSSSQVAVSTVATNCPCPTVTAIVSGLSSAAVNTPVQFTAYASAGTYAITGYAWDFGDGGQGNGQSVNHTYATAGTYTVRVTATSSCGNTGVGTSSIVIGSGGGGGGLTIMPDLATVNPGQQVRFTFSPMVVQNGDYVTFNFGDGTSHTVTYSSFCTIVGGCYAETHTYSQPGVYTVTGAGVAAGASVSGSTTITVLNNCDLPSAPTANFTWQPTQVRIGQVVQFLDGSTGGPTTWLWDFGGPGVSGSSVAQAPAVPLAGLAITPSSSTPTAGQLVTFTFSPGLSVSGDSVTFNFGDGQSQTINYCSPIGCGPSNTITHTYSQPGTYTVSGSGTAGGATVSGTTTIVVGGGGGTLTITPNPANATVGQTVTFGFSPTLQLSGDAVTFNYGDGNQGSVSYPCPLGTCAGTHAYSAAGTYVVSANGTAGGVAVSGSTTVVVSAVGGGGGTSTAQNPLYTYTAAGTYTVTLTATNCKGSSTTTRQIVVLGTCTQTGPPVADFNWGPTGTLTGYPEQQQPYAGQQVTLTDRSTNEPDTWHWYDFQEGAVDQTVTTPTFRYTWTQPGDKNVRMTARNCSGQWSSEVLKTVHIFEDVRHVTADFSWSPSDVSTGAQVTFAAAQGAAFGDPTGFNWTFDDGSTQTGSSVTYSFKCGGSRRVTLTAVRGGTTGTVTKGVTVAGTSCGPESVMGVDAAKIQGLNDTNWRADVRIYNPSAFPTSITLQFLPVGKDNVDPFTVGPYQPPLPPRGTLVLDDILQWVKLNFGQDFSKTALRFTYRTDDNVAPIVTIRTYNLRPDGSKYGQINPGVNVVPGTTPPVQWVTGLRNNGLTDGFRTNYSIVNLRGDPGGIGGITFTLFDETGAPRGSKTFGLAPFGYIQDSIKNLFGAGFENIGTFSLKLEVPTGGDVQVYASVMDNHTGDPVLIPATTPADSPIYLPAMAHLSGEAGTVWRTDLQLTNPDTDGPHTWEIRYTPKGTSLSVATRTIALAANRSFYVDDLVYWAYSGGLPADAQTSGIVRIAPVDGTNVYPIVAARSYNLTAVGTFGQGIAPLWAARGVSAPDPTRQVLTGMSSEDIARTNLGFVNLSETQGVNFVVSFYDDRGNILNPPGTDGQPKPYTYWIGPGTWDQDKLENRFRNAFKVSLPMSLPAITAEIRVTDGGPGFAYATVIDNKTGDPNFIPAQLTP